MARRSPGKDDDARFFGSAGPSTLALSAFGTAGLVPLLLITVIIGNPFAIIGCVVAIAFVVWLTLRALRRGYRLDGSVLTACGASSSSSGTDIDLRQVKRTARQRRESLALEMRTDSSTAVDVETQVELDLRLISIDAAVRLRSVMESEFGVDCSTWALTGLERVRRDGR